MAKSTKQDNKQSYTPEIADEICRRVSAGESLVGVCEDFQMPDTDTVMQWFVDGIDDFRERYLAASAAFLEVVVTKVNSQTFLPTRALAAQVCENMGYQNYDETLDQLVAAGALAN